jgi:hypothetical protein
VDRYSILPLSRELINSSKITLAIKAGHKLIPFGKREVLVEISGKEATEAYWKCTDSMSRTFIWDCPVLSLTLRTGTITFDEQPVTITFKLRPSQTVSITIILYCISVC